MTTVPRPLPAACHRARVLRALGVTPWRRRATADRPERPAVASADGFAACVVVLPEACSTRELDLLGRALFAGGATLARAARVRVRHGQLTDVPDALAYLAFGEAQAHALGRALSAPVMQQAQIVLADELAQVLTTAAAKRRLWSALRGLRRGLAAAAD